MGKKFEIAIKVISTATALLLAASEVLKQARLYLDTKNNNQPEIKE